MFISNRYVSTYLEDTQGNGGGEAVIWVYEMADA